jgi:hypothetical protein
MLTHAQLVVDVVDASYLAGQVFRKVLGIAFVDFAAQGHFTVLHVNVDVGSIEIGVIVQPFDDIFADTFI